MAVFLGPWKEKDYRRRVFGLSSTNCCNDAFEIVLRTEKRQSAVKLLHGKGFVGRTTQTPAMPYFPSAAFRKIALALLFWRSTGMVFG